MKEIKHLEDKYVVIKWDDIGLGLKLEQKEELYMILKTIQTYRKAQNKKENRYVVLNLDDEIDLDMLRRSLNVCRLKYTPCYYKVKDIAVDLVNAILKAKGDE